MRRSSIAIRWLMLSGFVALLAGIASIVLSTGEADAQPTEDPSATLAVSTEPSPDGTRTVAVGIDPGTSSLAALGAGLHYDADQVTVVSCAVSEAGACNDVGGEVRLSVFNLRGLQTNDQLLTVNFAPIDGATGSAIFELEVDTAIDSRGENLTQPAAKPLEVSLSIAERGSLTGDVIDPSSATGEFGIDVCVTNVASQTRTCTTTTGRGTWRLDELLTGDYTVEVTDPNGVYAAVTGHATVVANEVIAGIDAEMVLATSEQVADDLASDDDEDEIEQPGSASEEASDTADTSAEQDGGETTDPAGDEAPQPTTPAPTPSIVVRHEASITGTVAAPATLQRVEGVQVCATQVLVLQQSCAATNAAGEYVLTGVTTGNYWLTTVDPLGRFGEAKPRLVGVIRDNVTRAGVRLLLTSIAE